MSIKKLDHIDNISINTQNLPNNIQALSYLAEGIRVLASNVLSEEIKYTKNQGLVFSMSSGNNHQLANLFNWFAINSVSYCRLVTLFKLMDKNTWQVEDIKINREEIKRESNEYLYHVIPEIFQWRNKIAAHPAITDPYKYDNIATLEFSIMPNIVYLNNKFRAGALNWGSEGFESKFEEWSLTEIFEKRLIPRFWPEAKRIVKDSTKSK